MAVFRGEPRSWEGALGSVRGIRMAHDKDKNGVGDVWVTIGLAWRPRGACVWVCLGIKVSVSRGSQRDFGLPRPQF